MKKILLSSALLGLSGTYASVEKIEVHNHRKAPIDLVINYMQPERISAETVTVVPGNKCTITAPDDSSIDETIRIHVS